MSALDRALVRWARGPEHLARLRLLDAIFRVRGDRLLVVPYLDGTSLRVDPRSHIGRHVLYDGVYEKPIFDAIVANLTPDGVFLDIGCHMGCFAVPAATRCKRVIAVDAFRRMTDILRETVRLNRLTNVEVLHVALSDRSGEATLFLAADDQMSSLATDWSARGAQTAVVRTTTVGDLLSDLRIGVVDVMKIDAEGMSARIITGAAPVLQRIRAVVFEADADGGAQASSILQHSGFRVQPLPGGDVGNFLARR